MTGVAQALAAAGLGVARFEFGYMAARREGRPRPPPRAETLIGEYRDAVTALGATGRLVIGGKSMGGRVASMLADELLPRAGSRACSASATRSIRWASPTSCGQSISRVCGPRR